MESQEYVRPTPQPTSSVVWVKIPPSNRLPIQISSCSAFRPFSKKKKSIRVN